ncbi:hypothetical protein B9N43_05885 [Denitratisoma sp. DHT3]|uniref:TetR/AcrR family transcriptional regulator n=1 Tax=Denitratisoma sp. DHT3 TaxID=1981880 RepID=UPI0011986700|nr:TetR/AcrR family transcriptional regulator [Denitratisoma sp. DHT3]QDX80813.1 hypothetical protein B9N43_05885 [Denitratisoma sp. DHT3]
MAQVMSFNAPVQERLTPRSAATRAKLIAVAERLFAERGVDGVTLNEIGKAAGQRNAAVCQYHFGNKEALLQAIIDKHVPGIAARRHALLDQLEQAGRLGLRDVVKALIYPVAEKLLDADGGRDFIRINAQLVATHTLASQQLAASPFKVPLSDRLTRVIENAMAEYPLPPAVLKQRTMLAGVLLFHGLADHSRMLDAVEHPEAVVDTELFVHTLEDATVAMLSGPVSTW